MRYIKPLVGILLILCAAGGLIYWELQGRQMIMQDNVLVTVRKVNQGELVTRDLFSVAGIDHNNIMAGALGEKSLNRLEGQYAKHAIPQNAQIALDYFSRENNELKNGESVFSLKPGWIDSRSSSVRKGDLIEIYDERGETLLGMFKVAFVKDNSDKEITSLEDVRDDSLTILERTNATGYISNIEIITTVNKYGELVKFIEDTGKGLLIVQAGDHS